MTRTGRLLSGQYLTMLLLLYLFPIVAYASEPIVIAHRGASGYLPEHTIAAYSLAIDMGADYIEPDLVLTSDGILIVRHDHYLSTTTDIADIGAFTSRKKELDGRADWYTEDFTLEEIKQLRARQAFKGRTKKYDGHFKIPTFREVINLVREKSRERGYAVGIYPELKIPQYFKQAGFDIAAIFLAELKASAFDKIDSRIFIQSFDPGILRSLNTRTNLPLVQLVSPMRNKDGMLDPIRPNIALGSIAAYADVVGVHKALIAMPDGTMTGLVESAHRLNLLVHVWTLRDDAYPARFFSSADDEIIFFLKSGADGLFTDFPDSAVRVRNRIFSSPHK